MNKKIITLLIGIILIAFVGYGSSGSCGGNGWSPPPQIPEEEPEPTLGKVTLQWNPNTEPELTGYRIYYGQSSGDYLYYDQIGCLTIHTVIDLQKDVPWYFVVTAYATYPVWAESECSNEVSCIISD